MRKLEYLRHKLFFSTPEQSGKLPEMSFADFKTLVHSALSLPKTSLIVDDIQKTMQLMNQSKDYEVFNKDAIDEFFNIMHSWPVIKEAPEYHSLTTTKLPQVI